MLATIILKPFHHLGKENIAICFTDCALTKSIRQIRGIRWFQARKCWYLPLSKENYDLIKQKVEGIATIETTELRQYLEQRRGAGGLINQAHISRKRTTLFIAYHVCPENIEAFSQFQTLIQIKGYSPNTLRTYSDAFYQLLRLLGSVSINSLSKDNIQAYLLWLIKNKGCSESHVHTVVNALKFYFEKVENRPKEFFDLPRPKKPQKLPSILGETEVERLFKTVKNLKHQALLMTAYSAGLRVSELVNLQIRDVDSVRMMIHIHSGKGKKDRMVTLSRILVTVLRNYYKLYKPKEFLFEGEKGRPYSTRSAQMILHRAKGRGRHSEER